MFLLLLLLPPPMVEIDADLPPVSDCARLPHWPACQDAVWALEGSCTRAAAQRCLEYRPWHYAELDETAGELHRRLTIWEAAREAQRDRTLDEGARREALGRLRTLLGEEDYEAGWLPCPYVLEAGR